MSLILVNGVYHLEGALEAWATRADAGAGADVRQAANVAIEVVDSLLAELHRVRSELITEMRQFDDATAARVDAMLGQAKSL